jgi:hypothetical protein
MDVRSESARVIVSCADILVAKTKVTIVECSKALQGEIRSASDAAYSDHGMIGSKSPYWAPIKSKAHSSPLFFRATLDTACLYSVSSSWPSLSTATTPCFDFLASRVTSEMDEVKSVLNQYYFGWYLRCLLTCLAACSASYQVHI